MFSHWLLLVENSPAQSFNSGKEGRGDYPLCSALSQTLIEHQKLLEFFGGHRPLHHKKYWPTAEINTGVYIKIETGQISRLYRAAERLIFDNGIIQIVMKLPDAR